MLLGVSILRFLPFSITLWCTRLKKELIASFGAQSKFEIACKRTDSHTCLHISCTQTTKTCKSFLQHVKYQMPIFQLNLLQEYHKMYVQCGLHLAKCKVQVWWSSLTICIETCLFGQTNITYNIFTGNGNLTQQLGFTSCFILSVLFLFKL